jgi:hypothetical protein
MSRGIVRTVSCAAAFLLALSLSFPASQIPSVRSGLQAEAYAARPMVFAEDRGRERAPYGISEEGEYGEQRQVTSLEQARKILEDYFSKKDVKIGRITEKKLYFKAEIRGADGRLVDVVVVDKRTGRIRSIY